VLRWSWREFGEILSCARAIGPHTTEEEVMDLYEWIEKLESKKKMQMKNNNNPHLM
jgi:hypothetical protein